MSSPKTRREVTHDRIVDVAAREVRRNGYAGVGVADVMKQAGLTHGGFYAHFDSREALLAEAIQRAGEEGSARIKDRIEAGKAKGVTALRALLDRYLSEDHLTGPDKGCVVAALASEMARQSSAVREASAARVNALISLVHDALRADGAKGRTKDQATVIASTLVGALQMARTLGDNAEGLAVLAAAKKSLLTQYEM